MTEDEILLTHIIKCRYDDLKARSVVLTTSQQIQFQEYKSRRKDGEPLQYIIGEWDFYGLTFKVNPFVLVPRPETEGLVELVLAKVHKGKVLDLGTGSGNIAVTIAHQRPFVNVVTVDISKNAMELAKANAQAHEVESRIHFIQAPMQDYLDVCQVTFDCIVSNPPYIPTDQIKTLPKDVQHEPVLALDGGPDGLDFYRSIIKSSPRLLRTGGCLMMEFGDGQELAIKGLADAQAGFSQIKIHQDLTGRNRYIELEK